MKSSNTNASRLVAKTHLDEFMVMSKPIASQFNWLTLPFFPPVKVILNVIDFEERLGCFFGVLKIFLTAGEKFKRKVLLVFVSYRGEKHKTHTNNRKGTEPST